MYLLDTNHCSAILDNNQVIIKKLVSLGNTPTAICVIVQAELMYMVERSEKRAENLKLVNDFLNIFPIYQIDSETATIYAQMKSQLMQHYGPRDKKKLRNFELKKVGIGDNDLWIAAIALKNHLALVSKDSDFERIVKGGISGLTVESWL